MSAEASLLIRAPDHAGPGFRWVADVLLGRFLGLPWRLAEAPAEHFSIEGPEGRVEWPDRFFARAARARDQRTLPAQPWPAWTLPEPALARALGEPTLPLMFADGEFSRQGRRWRLPLDLFGAAFFMLSRWEEALPGAPRDRHGRFPAAAASMHQAGVLQRPLVDEYVELLAWVLGHVAPGWVRRDKGSSSRRVWLSCDVDAPYTAGARGPLLAARQAASHLRNDRSVALALRSVAAAAAAPFGATAIDPFDTFEYMLDRLERAGLAATFYFLALDRPNARDAWYRLEERRMAALLARLVERGHQIGLHGSYASVDDAPRLAQEAQRLRQAVERAGGRQREWSARQHYLRWMAARTPRHLAQAGFDSDSTVAFAEAPGFRCGTSRAFPMWDLEAGIELPIVERPLVAMDVSVTSRSYMGLGFGEPAYAAFDTVARRCRRFGGEFSLLWHNSNLALPGSRALFERLIGPP
jgi:peptidoglycan/xylan/chitin deacetylase (PgdA/CDA1 family)